FEGLDSVASNPPSLKSFLAQHPTWLDSQSRALYRACASALLRILLEHENGRAQLNRYIADLPRASVDALSDLQAHFPWLGKDPESTEKNWRENVIRVANERRFALITFAATSEQLDECLRTKIAQDRGKKNSLNLEETVRVSRPNLDTRIATEFGPHLTILGAWSQYLLC